MKKQILKKDDKYDKLNISLPNIYKKSTNKNIQIILPEMEVNEKDLIVKLFMKVNKVKILESKIDYIFRCVNKSEKDFILFEECKKNLTPIKINIDNKIINSIDDFIIISIVIKEKLNKNIKDIKLLYRAIRDGDETQFHSKCDGKSNTVTFVIAINGRKFGDFIYKEWNSDNEWIIFFIFFRL